MQMGKTIAVDVVRKIFEWRADGWSLLEIGRQFQKSKCWSHYVLQHYSEETFAPLTAAKRVSWIDLA